MGVRVSFNISCGKLTNNSYRDHEIIEMLHTVQFSSLQFSYSGDALWTMIGLKERTYHSSHYTSAHGSGRRYYILLLKFLSFFTFATGSPRWLYRQGTFLAHKVGYRCNFKNRVQNLGGDPPIKIWGPNPPNVVNQSQRTWSKLILGIGRENEYPKLVSKFWGLSPQKIAGESKLAQILQFSDFFAYFSKTVQDIVNLKTDL